MMEGLQVNKKDALKTLKAKVKDLNEKYTSATQREDKALLYSQLEKSKKELEMLEASMSKTETVLDKVKILRKKIKELNEQYKSTSQREDKAIIYSQLEKAQKELAKLEEELDKKSKTKIETSEKPIPATYTNTESSTLEKVTNETTEAAGPTTTKEARKFKVGFVDTTDVMKSNARDAGDAAMTMEVPANPEELKGLKKFFKGEYWKRAKDRLWKHGLWREYYRNKEIEKAREKILKTGNIFAGEGKDQVVHDKFVSDVMEQFTSEYEEAIHREAGETRRINEEIKNEKEVKDTVKKLILSYASGKINKEAFLEEEGRIFAGLKADTEGRVLQKKEDVMHASNMYAVAEQVREAMQAGTFLEGEDFEIDLIYGKSKGDVRTEAKFSKAESLAERLSHTKIGQFANETTIATALSIASSAGVKLSRGLTNSTVTKILPFIGTALISSGVAKVREGKKVEEERRQHAREMARGGDLDFSGMDRRMEMEESRYQTTRAVDLIASLSQSNKNILENPGALNQEMLIEAVSALSAIEAQIGLSDRRNIDLISYSNSTNVVAERRNIDIERAKMKVALRKLFEEGKFTIPEIKDADSFKVSDFETYFTSLINTHENALLTKEDSGIEAKDRIFNKMKSQRSWAAARKAFMSGLVIGTVTQELTALATNRVGIIEDTFHHTDGPHNLTALAKLKHIIQGESAPAGPVTLHDALPGSPIQIPTGSSLVSNPDGTYNLLADGKVVADHLTTNPDGTFTEDARNLLQGQGINVDTHSIDSTATQTVASNEYVQNHPGSTHEIHRSWYDNDTKEFDRNELRTFWGGEHNTGITSNGEYVLDVGHMTPDGSFHGGLSAQAQELLKEGKLKMLLSLSKDTQDRVFEIPINADGKILVDPSSEIGKIFFTNANGHAQFLGRFGEIGQDMGENHYTMLSTMEGPGVTGVADLVQTQKIQQILNLPVVSNDYDLPPIIPLVPRQPLEKQRKESLLPPTYYNGATLNEIVEEFKRRNIPLDSYKEETAEDGAKKWVNQEGKEVKRNFERERQRISAYLAQQEKKYMEELKSFNRGLEPMSKECRVAVIIPARFEQTNLKNLLDQYVQQVDENGQPLNKDLFEINIIINRKEGEVADKSIEIIEKWKKENPGYHVNAIDIVFTPDQANVGTARKYITDLSLLRSSERTESGGPLYIESEDADLFSIDKRTINTLIKGFDSKPHLDVLRGMQDRQPEVLSTNDLFLFERRLWDIGEMRMRELALRPGKFKDADFTWNRVISGGWNTAYTAEAYAEIGGYVPDRIGEDMKIGQKISILRGENGVPNTYTAETSGLRANSSPRRFIAALAQGKGPYDTDIWEDQSLKGKSLTELMSQIKKWEKISPEQKQRYEAGINTLYTFMKERMGKDNKETRKTMKSTLFYSGLKEGADYVFNSKNEVQITEEGYKKLGEMLAKYRKDGKWKLGYRRQNSPLVLEKSKINRNKKEVVNTKYGLMEAQINNFINRYPDNITAVDSTIKLLSKALTDKVLKTIGLNTSFKELSSQLEACKGITDRDKFTLKVSEVLKPLGLALENHPKEFIAIQRKLFPEAYNLKALNEMLSYGINEGDLHLHLAPSQDLSTFQKLKLLREAFVKIKDVLNTDPSVKEVSATSWIVESNPGLFEKLGFEIKNERITEGGNTRIAKKAVMSREKFLKKKFNR